MNGTSRIGVKRQDYARVSLTIFITAFCALLSSGLRAQDVSTETTVLIDDRPLAGFKSLFNGRDLTGWTGNPQLWSVKDGAIVGRTTAEAGTARNTFLIWTNGTVGSFELRIAYRIVPGDDKGFANSGIQYRSKVLDSTNWVVGGYQADLEAGTKFSGILYDEAEVAGGRRIMAARGERVVWDKECQKQVVGSLGNSEDLQAAIKKEDWNEYVIIAQGNHLQHFINGRNTVDVTDECEGKRLTRGVLALQLHAGPPMRVEFKDVRLKSMADVSDAGSVELQRFQGSWSVVAGEAGGDAMPQEDCEKILVTIKDGHYTMNNGDESDHGRFTVHPSATPRTMDIMPETGGRSGEVIPAIYEFISDGFRVCYNPGGSERPAAFKTTPESGFVLFTYKRRSQ